MHTDHGGAVNGEPLLVGRDSEVARLLALATQAAGGQGRVAVLEGEPGVGKSTLLHTVTRTLERRGTRVLAGAAEELDRHFPFASISTCWAGEGGPGRIGQLLQEAGSYGANAEISELAMIERVLAQVEQWCADSPVALVLDDLQWADPATLAVLRWLFRITPQLPLLLLLAHRPILPAEPVARLVRDAVQLHLEPLREEAVATLVSQTLQARPDARLLAMVHIAGGNPL